MQLLAESPVMAQRTSRLFAVYPTRKAISFQHPAALEQVAAKFGPAQSAREELPQAPMVLDIRGFTMA
jgi:hypothetical protein